MYYLKPEPLSSKSDRRLRLGEELIPEWTLATPPNSTELHWVFFLLFLVLCPGGYKDSGLTGKPG